MTINVIFFPLFLCLFSATVSADYENTLQLLMPYVTARKDESVCMGFKLTEDFMYISKMELVMGKRLEKMSGFGCSSVASTTKPWLCSPTSGNGKHIFKWSLNASLLALPEDVAFKIGSKTEWSYFVLVVRYSADVMNDRSGVSLIYQKTPKKYEVGVMTISPSVFANGPKSAEITTRGSCTYEGAPIKIFAYGVQTHELADVVSSYRVRNGQWLELERTDVTWPQSFYPTGQEFDFQTGDVLTGICTYHHDLEYSIHRGQLKSNEMCNVNFIYYVESASNVQNNCTYSENQIVENMIPNDALQKPPMPVKIREIMFNLENFSYDDKSAQLGRIVALKVDQKTGNLIVLHQSTQKWNHDSFDKDMKFNVNKYSPIARDPVVVFDKTTGQIVHKFGANQLYLPHGLTIDDEGNVWITDMGRHQVLKFAPNGTGPLLEVGEKMIPGNDEKHLCQPSDVAVLKNGDFFVADGHCNSRVIKFAKNGTFISQLKSEDRRIPRSLAVNEHDNRLCVADGDKYPVKCFDLNGDYLFTSPVHKGPIYHIDFAPDNKSILYALNAGVRIKKKLLMLSAVDGTLLGMINLTSQIKSPHVFSAANNGREIYIGNFEPPKIFKYGTNNMPHHDEKQKGRKVTKMYNRFKGWKVLVSTSSFLVVLLIPFVIIIPLLFLLNLIMKRYQRDYSRDPCETSLLTDTNNNLTVQGHIYDESTIQVLRSASSKTNLLESSDDEQSDHHYRR